MSTLLRLLGVFGLLSVLAVGGGLAVLPEMKKLTVEQYHWVTANQFVDFYSLGQMAPGPNMIMVALIGYKVAGLGGALAVLIAFFLPASVLTFGAKLVRTTKTTAIPERTTQKAMRAKIPLLDCIRPPKTALSPS